MGSLVSEMGRATLWAFGLLSLLGLYVHPACGQRFREDGKCGGNSLAPDGNPADCDHIEPFPTCCQINGHCGWDCDHVSGQSDTLPAAPVRQTTSKPQFASNGRYRPDGRCGLANPLDDGTPAECDPNSEYWCCSEHGFCGGTHEHCFCDTCINFRPLDLDGNVRSDRRCGKEFPLTDGSPSECDGNSPNYCCSKFGFCGPGPDHCDCVGCIDFRSKTPIEKAFINGKVRADRRCGGGEFSLPSGEPSECDPNSVNPCCSKWGFCGPDSDHCSCPECVDYRPLDQRTSDFIGRVRKDRRCGNEFPLADGSPSECDPEAANFCCSKWGFCGPDSDHCDCPECVNYRLVSGLVNK